MKTLNIAFFGTSDKSTPILEELNQKFNLAICVTKNDTLVGRKQIRRQTGVKKWALENKVSFLEISSTKGKELADITTELTKNHIDIGVMADFNYIIPTKIISTLNNRLINIHFSLLPKYRGASPIQHTILNQEKVTGITYMLTDKSMDTGDILYQSKYPLSGTETTGELYDTLFSIAAKELPKVINDFIQGKIEPQKQIDTDATYCYSKSHTKSTYIYKKDAYINWNDSLKAIYAQIRAFYPWPVAFTTMQDLHNSNLAINEKNSISKIKKPKYKTLHIKSVTNKKIKIIKAEFIKDELLPIEVQVEGKNIIKWEDFLNGYVSLTN